MPLLAACPSPIPTVLAAVAALGEGPARTLREASSLLVDHGFALPDFDPRGLLAISKIAAPGRALEVGEVDGVVRIGSPGAVVVAEYLVREAQRQVRRNGLADVEVLLAATPPEFDRATLVEVLRGNHDARLSPSGRWVALADVAGTRLHERLRKMLGVTRRLGVGEFRKQVLTDPRMSGMDFPRDAAEFFLASCRLGTVSDGVFNADVEACPEPIDVLSEIELTMVAALRAEGGILTLGRFEKACVALGVNRNTFRLYVSWSPAIQRLSKGVYALVGANPAPEVQRRIILADTSLRQQALLAHGTTGQGAWYAMWRITASSLKNGVLSLPTALRAHVSGKFEVVSSDGSKLGICAAACVAISGMRRALAAAAVRADDIVRLTFDPVSRRAELVLESPGEAAG